MPPPLKIGSLAKALRLDNDDDNRRPRLRFINGEGTSPIDRLELQDERKHVQRKLKDLTLRMQDENIMKQRAYDRVKSAEEEKRQKKSQKTMESAIRMEKNREWRRRRELERLLSTDLSNNDALLLDLLSAQQNTSSEKGSRPKSTNDLTQIYKRQESTNSLQETSHREK